MAVTSRNLFMDSSNLIKVNALTNADTSALINDADIEVSICHADIRNPTANGAAVDKGGGVVGIPCVGHGLKEGDWVYIHGTTNYEGINAITSGVSADEITITATYVAETFHGEEQIYLGMLNATEKDFVAVGSGGNYKVTIDFSTVPLVENDYYYLVIHTVKDSSKLVSRPKWKAIYHS